MANKNIDGRTLWNPLSGIIQGTGGTMNALAVAIGINATLAWVLKIAMTDNIAIQINWTGALKGVFTLQTCLDYTENEAGAITVAGNWTDITTNGVAKVPFCTKSGTDPSGANTGPVMFNVNMCAPQVLRLVYTADGAAPGAGTMTGWQNGKGV